MPPIPQCPVNCLIVELSSAYDEVMEFKSGVKLFKDVSWNPEWNTTCTGKILSVPNTVQKRYDFNGVMDARAGDEVIFSYMVVEDKEQREGDTPIHRNQFYHDGKYYWKVHLMHVLGYVRDGQLIPTAGKVFMRDIPEAPRLTSSILILHEDVSGKSTLSDRKKNRAEVMSVGEAKEDSVKPSLAPGDLAVYDDRYAERYDLGKDWGKIVISDFRYIAGVETAVSQKNVP